MWIVLIVLSVLLALVLFLMRTEPMKEEYEFVRGVNFAHRGLHSKDSGTVENSMAAFHRAVAKGYGIELDVQLTKDGQVVVFHDDSLLRMCGVDRLLCEMTYQELSECRLLDSGEGIPLFSEVLVLVGGKVPLYIEIKYAGRCCGPLCQALGLVLVGYPNNYMFASFHPFALRDMKKRYPKVMRVQIVQAYQGSTLPWWQRFALEHLLFNFIAGPHGISYEHNKTNWSYWVCKWMMAYSIGWTIDSMECWEQCQDKFDGLVFEQFESPVVKRRLSL